MEKLLQEGNLSTYELVGMWPTGRNLVKPVPAELASRVSALSLICKLSTSHGIPGPRPPSPGPEWHISLKLSVTFLWTSERTFE